MRQDLGRAWPSVHRPVQARQASQGRRLRPIPAYLVGIPKIFGERLLKARPGASATDRRIRKPHIVTKHLGSGRIVRSETSACVEFDSKNMKEIQRKILNEIVIYRHMPE